MPSEAAKPYDEPELDERARGIHARPWPRIFATLYFLVVGKRQLERKLNDLEERIAGLEDEINDPVRFPG